MPRAHALLPLLLVACTSARAAPAVAPAASVTVVKQPALPEPTYLPAAARLLLRERMSRHRDELSMLSSSALALAYPELEVAAGEIVGEPQLMRPGPDDRDTLNARLPPRFFDLQAELVARAKALQASAAARNGPEVARTYGQLTETCVACHAVYLRGP